jgi:hypothetical protein
MPEVATQFVRPPAVAGRFYPADPAELRRRVEEFLSGARNVPALSQTGDAWESYPTPKAIIAPHAGYVFSGPIAGSAFSRFLPDKHQIERIVLIGPAHYVRIRGVVAPEWRAFSTPLGTIPVDAGLLAALDSLPQVSISNQPHAPEHALEVELPFLQVVLDRFSVLPLVAGDAGTSEIAEVLEKVWGGPETRIVASSDLSHFFDYRTARELDAETAKAIVALEPAALGEESACGRVPIRGLLEVARRHGLKARLLDLRNSGDTAGPRQEVVGYGAFAFA